MRRFPLIAFMALIAATVAAFFITQHLKTVTPLIAAPQVNPAAINPVSGGTCFDPLDRRPVKYRLTNTTFYLMHQSDSVDVYVVNQAGDRVATLTAGRFMRVPVPASFSWDGRGLNGRLVPDGTYYVTVHLIHQDRTVTIANYGGPLPLRVITAPPQPVVTSVSPRVLHGSRPTPVRVSFSGDSTLGARVLIYRLTQGTAPRLVDSYAVAAGSHRATWNGLIGGQPAPAGTYLVGLKVTNAACTTGSFPSRLDALSASAVRSEVRVLP